MIAIVALRFCHHSESQRSTLHLCSAFGSGSVVVLTPPLFAFSLASWVSQFRTSLLRCRLSALRSLRCSLFNSLCSAFVVYHSTVPRLFDSSDVGSLSSISSTSRYFAHLLSANQSCVRCKVSIRTASSVSSSSRVFSVVGMLSIGRSSGTIDEVGAGSGIVSAVRSLLSITIWVVLVLIVIVSVL